MPREREMTIRGGGGGRALREFMAPGFTLVQGLGKACVGTLSG